MAKASKSDRDESKKTPKITKFAGEEPALPTGQSSIEIIKNTDPRDLKTATEDANQELASMVARPGDTPEPAEQSELEPKAKVVPDQPVESKKIVEPEEAPEQPEEAKESEPDEAEAEPSEEPEQSYEPEAEPESKKPDTDELDEGIADDAVTERAIEEIVAEEGDAALAAQDRKLGMHQESKDTEEAEVPIKPSKQPGKFKRFWSRPLTRWLAIGGTLAVLLLVAATPQSRYFILNTAGVRAAVQLKVVDNSTTQPLKNVTVSAAGVSGQTDDEGNVRLSGVRLGKTTLVIEKRAFTRIEKPITVGWGSNPLHEFKVQAVGAQYSFVVKDFLTNQPIDGAQAVSGDGNASSDGDGKIFLTLDTANQEDKAQVSVDITADGYRKETVNLTVNNKEVQSVTLVPSRRHAFVSKKSGKYDVYTVDIDGKNEQKLVSGTGIERDDITLIPHQKQSVAALISTRENVRNGSGYLLSTLYVVNTDNGTLTKIDQSERIQIVGWSRDGHLVYVKNASGASASDAKRQRLMSFNAADFSDTRELAAYNTFNDVLMADSRVYLAPSSSFLDGGTTGVFTIDVDGKNAKEILNHEAFALQRSNYETIDMNVGETWYTYNISSKADPKPSQPSVAGVSRLYVDNAGGSSSLWTDQRDSKGVLLKYDIKSKEDATITSRAGLGLPVYWLNDTVAVFRVKDSRGTADYVTSVLGGESHKITDVSNSSGLENWSNN